MATPPTPSTAVTPCQATPTCHHPTNCTCTLRDTNLDFGLRVGVAWESPTGNAADLSSCHVTELITRSAIPNPPFGPADGSTVPDSGQTRRIPAGDGLPGSDCAGQDTHQCPRAMLRTPPSAGSYTVDQAYQYNCSICGCGWTTLASYVISYTVYQKPNNEWWLKTVKTGPGGPFESDERI